MACSSPLSLLIIGGPATTRMSPHGLFVFGGTTKPSTLKLPVDQLPPNGITEVPPAAFTPGTCAMRGITAS